MSPTPCAAPLARGFFLRSPSGLSGRSWQLMCGGASLVELGAPAVRHGVWCDVLFQKQYELLLLDSGGFRRFPVPFWACFARRPPWVLTDPSCILLLLPPRSIAWLQPTV